jgi:hypothetical protein
MSTPPVDSSHIMEAHSRRTWARPEEWELHRPLIKRLYVDEDRTLKEVMKVMSSEHGLHGT